MEADDAPPPSKIARHALYGTGSSSGLRRSIDKYVGLRLELGCSSPSSRASSSSGFSFLQLQELEHQALIYTYMEAGLPVPHHLLLPIWKSVATSFTITAQLNSGSRLLHQQSPNQLAGLSWLCEEYKKSTQAAESEGRCRRTDGKKWRCSKDVVPDHKYCDKHIHRGRRHRSSKQYRQQAET